MTHENQETSKTAISQATSQATLQATPQAVPDEITEQVTKMLKAKNKNVGASEIKIASAKAYKLVQDAQQKKDNSILKGAEAMRNLSLAMGLPVPRILFAEMAKRGSAKSKPRKKIQAQIAGMSKISETACIKAKFVDIKTKREKTAYLYLAACGADHDLTAQLDKLFSRIAKNKEAEMKQHLSVLVYLGRNAYARMLALNKDLVGNILHHLPTGFNPRVLMVDPKNTTLYLQNPCSQRVGIFIGFESEINGDASTSKSAENLDQ